MKILVCEDDPSILEVVSLIIEEMGHSVARAKNRKQFISKTADEKFDLYILDYWLNGSKTDDIVKKLRNNDETRNKPLMLISATTNLKAIGERLKADAVVAKPFELDHLQEQINSLLLENQ